MPDYTRDLKMVGFGTLAASVIGGIAGTVTGNPELGATTTGFVLAGVAGVIAGGSVGPGSAIFGTIVAAVGSVIYGDAVIVGAAGIGGATFISRRISRAVTRSTRSRFLGDAAGFLIGAPLYVGALGLAHEIHKSYPERFISNPVYNPGARFIHFIMPHISSSGKALVNGTGEVIDSTGSHTLGAGKTALDNIGKIGLVLGGIALVGVAFMAAKKILERSKTKKAKTATVLVSVAAAAAGVLGLYRLAPRHVPSSVSILQNGGAPVAGKPPTVNVDPLEPRKFTSPDEPILKITRTCEAMTLTHYDSPGSENLPKTPLPLPAHQAAYVLKVQEGYSEIKVPLYQRGLERDTRIILAWVKNNKIAPPFPCQ